MFRERNFFCLYNYVKPVKYLRQTLHFTLNILFEIAQTMCLIKTNVIRVRKVFQNSVKYKSNACEKIIPTRLETKSPIFSRRVRFIESNSKNNFNI